MEHIKVELEVGKEFSSLQKMVLFIKELGKTIICGAMVDWLLKIFITKDKLEMEWLMESGHLKTAKKYIQGNGGVIKDMEMDKKSTRISAIDIRVSSSMTNIMGEEYYRTRNTLIRVTSFKASLMEMEWLGIKMDSFLLEDLELVKR